ncbi:MAG: hypothetical protein QOE55_6701 [Acidobacteriaceae bacterium]|jgi:hypothetical protein|nr:hypothetical protein [Acidobacteriaceae bacterium]MEA3006349.1 hypothetical protein [Acidobacteriaceae bacterium]
MRGSRIGNPYFTLIESATSVQMTSALPPGGPVAAQADDVPRNLQLELADLRQDALLGYESLIY